MNQQKGSALIGLLVVVCIMGLLFFYYTGRDEGAESRDPVKTIKTYNKAQDDIGEIRKQLDKKNDIIKNEVASTSVKEVD